MLIRKIISDFSTCQTSVPCSLFPFYSKLIILSLTRIWTGVFPLSKLPCKLQLRPVLKPVKLSVLVSIHKLTESPYFHFLKKKFLSYNANIPSFVILTKSCHQISLIPTFWLMIPLFYVKVDCETLLLSRALKQSDSK